MAKKPTPAAAADPKPADSSPDAAALLETVARSKRAWSDRSAWDKFYSEAYEFAIPMRRPPKYGNKGPVTADRVFDLTATTAAVRFAGQMQQDLFPPGQSFFTLRPGKFAALSLAKDDLAALEAELEQVTAIAEGLIQTAEWDQATHEMCLDLSVGTGIILMPEGDDERPMRFVTIPNDEAALELGPYNEVCALHWKTRMPRRAIKASFPKGKFPRAFLEELEKAEGANAEVELNQSFLQDGKQWLMRVWLEGSTEEGFVETGTFRTKPFIAPRYCRVPGEAYGRGPVIFALPAIKTINKAQEITLKAAAIQMLGIWGYRPGGAFNPDTARIAPGVFWPMGATGGVLGAEVSRLDPASGNLQVSALIRQDLAQQIQTTMHDERIPSKGATPVSASEVLERSKQMRQNYVGAFSRLVNETVPDVVKRAVDIAFRRNLVKHSLSIDEFLVRVDVLSPLAAAMRADHLTPIVQFIEMVAQLRPQTIDDHIKVDDALDLIGSEMNVPARLRPNEKERKTIRADRQKQQIAAAATQAALDNAGALMQGGAEEPQPAGVPA